MVANLFLNFTFFGFSVFRFFGFSVHKPHSMQRALILLPFLLLFLIACQSDRGRPGPPNFVILFADDLGYGDLSCYGNDTIRTPNLDRLASKGRRFTQFYSASPACSASRYALLTGRYPAWSGFGWVLNPDATRGLHPQDQTIAEALRNAGYATACFGKWHLGTYYPEFLPTGSGFDEYLGLPYSNDMIPPLWQDIALLEGTDTLEMNPDQTRLTRLYTERAIDFIRRHREQPFFVYLPYAMPHVPLHPGPDFAGRSPRGPYGDVVEEIDWSAGQIAATLEELGIAGNTLVFFTSDNGPWIIKGRDGGSAGPLRDGKGSSWEGGQREPAIAWWPGKISPAQVKSPASMLDLYPTLLSLAGQPMPQNHPLDGRDISTLLTGTTPELPENTFFYYGINNELHAVRRGRWKLHRKTYSQTGIDYFDGKLPLLFDLEADPGETEDLADDHPGIVAELEKLLERQLDDVAGTPDFFTRERLAQLTEHLAFERPVQMRYAPSEKYGPPAVLTDGLPGDSYELKTMAGVEGRDLEATIDLGDPMLVERLSISFLHRPQSWIFQPAYIEFFISTDGQQYKSRGRLTPNRRLDELRPALDTFTVQMRTQTARYIKVVGKNRGTCPPGHPHAGKPAWVFAGEVEVE